MLFFKTIVLAMAKIAGLGVIGYALAKSNILTTKVNRALVTLIIYVTLPLFIISEIVGKFDFQQYPLWWMYPLLSIVITLVGCFFALMHLRVIPKKHSPLERRQIISLVAFQNAGYLPLIIAAELFAPEVAEELFVHIFLFLIGFNLLVWSVGARFLCGSSMRDLRIGNLFSPPGVAIVVSLLAVFFGLGRLIPAQVLHYTHGIGKLTLPLAMIAIGANLAYVSLRNVDRKVITAVSVIKLIVLPVCAIVVLVVWKLPELLGFLILIELAVPSATSLSLIVGRYNIEDKYISQGVFFTHIASIVTIPIFLIIFHLLR
ncbi:AEC family transporter [Candidatus Omnitrophota bacterium]